MAKLALNDESCDINAEFILRNESPSAIIFDVLDSYSSDSKEKGVQTYMGKNLKGKECGKGICQRKDGKYTARYVSKLGKRRKRHFDTLPEAKKWLSEVQYEDQHDLYVAESEMPVDEWFAYRKENLICDLAYNTIYRNILTGI